MAHSLLISGAMSTKGIYTAVSGAAAQSTKIDTIANNIANANTPGFKKDKQLFQEYLTTYERIPTVLEAPRVPASVESFYPLNGGDKSFVDAAGTATVFEQGSLKLTGNPFDLALEGDAFFQVLTPAGVRFTRNGHFTKNAEGVVVTKDGYPLLTRNEEGLTPQDRVIQVDQRQLNITAQGDIFIGGQNIGQLALQTVTEKDALHKMGNSLFSLRDNFANEVVDANNYKVHQGAIENSNVNVIAEMTEMIKATRVFESTQKAIQAYDQMNQKLYNEVPRTR